MEANQSAPDCLVINSKPVFDGHVNDDCPITVGCKYSLSAMSTQSIVCNKDTKKFYVPTTCPEHRFRAPSGLGSTMVTNSGIMKFPEEQTHGKKTGEGNVARSSDQCRH